MSGTDLNQVHGLVAHCDREFAFEASIREGLVHAGEIERPEAMAEELSDFAHVVGGFEELGHVGR